METVIVGEYLYPDPSEELDRQLSEFTKRTGIEVNFLYDSGSLKFTYPENRYIARPGIYGLVSFIDRDTTRLAISVINDFGLVRVEDETGSELVIPIIEE